MNILNKLTYKHLLLNKKRTIVTIIGILLATSMMVGIGLLVSTFRESMIDYYILAHGSHHSIIRNVNPEKLNIVEKTSELKELGYYSPVGFAKYQEGTNPTKPYFYIMKANDTFLSHLELLEGRLPENEEEIVLSSHMFNQGTATYTVGDTLTLEYGNRILNEQEVLDLNRYYDSDETLQIEGKKTYKIVGIVNRSVLESTRYPAFFLFTKLENIENSSSLDLVLTFKKPEKATKLTETLAETLSTSEEALPTEYNEMVLSMYGASSYNNYNAFLKTLLLTMLSILSVACMIVIYNSFAISVMERKKQFGLLSSVGATKKQIEKMVFLEATIEGAIGIFLGLFGAYFGIYVTSLFIGPLLVEMFPAGMHFAVYPSFVLIPILFIILVVYLSAYLPAYRASKISPIEVIRQNDDIKMERKKLKTRKIVSSIFGIEGEIAFKNLKRNRKKYRITIVSLVTSIVIFISFYTYLDYGKSTVSDYSFDTNYDIWALSKEEDEESILKKLYTHEDVTSHLEFYSQSVLGKVESSFYTKNYLAIKQQESSALEEDVYLDRFLIVLLKGEEWNRYKKDLKITDDSPIIYNFSKRVDYSDGNRVVEKGKVLQERKEVSIPLVYELKSGGYRSFLTLENFHFADKIPELFENFSNETLIFVDEDTYQEIVEKSHLSRELAYRCNSFIKAKKFDKLDGIADIYDQREGFQYENVRNMEDHDQDLVLAIEVLFYGLLILVTLIGVTSVFNTISTSINLRRKEFAILRSVGLSPKGMKKMIWFESLIFGVKSLLYGIPLGILLSYFISNNMGMIVANNFHLPIVAMGISVVGVFVIVIISMWYSTSKIRKENILESIRDENI